MSDEQKQAAVVLWASGLFDTAEISALLAVPEHAVERIVRMAREMAREMAA